MKSLDEVIHAVVLQNNAKAIAEELNKPYSTFMREINPQDFDAKFAASLLIPLTRATDDFSVIDYIEQALGRVAFHVPKKKNISKQLIAYLSKLTKDFGGLLEVLSETIEEGCVTQDDIDRCNRCGYETIQAVAMISEALKKHDGGK